MRGKGRGDHSQVEGVKEGFIRAVALELSLEEFKQRVMSTEYGGVVCVEGSYPGPRNFRFQSVLKEEDFPSEKNLRLLPFTIQSFPKALGLRKVGGHQGRDTRSTHPQRQQ